MIDVAHNESNGMTVVHDEPGLDGARSVLVAADGRCGFVASDGHLRMTVRPLPPGFLAGIRGVGTCDFIRVDGGRPVSTHKVRVRHVGEVAA